MAALSSELQIGAALTLPVEAVTEALAIVGQRGSGKTTTAKVIVEEFTRVGQQVVVIDPLGVWWGLKSSADGSKAGLPFVVIGGDHADIPLTADAGDLLANLVVDETVSIVLDLSGLRKGKQISFCAAFLERLYHRNRAVLHVVVDEADLLAPQRARADTARVLGAMEDLVRRGRARGLGVTVITQRPASLHKDVLTQASTLVSHRLTGPQDRRAVESWVTANGTDEQRERLLGSLAVLETGEAWWWSPSWLDIFSRVRTRRPRTFDSSATPKAGEVRAQPRTFARVDLDALRKRMEAVVAVAEEHDPAALRRRVRGLEAELMAVRDTSGRARVEKVVEEVRVEVEVVPPVVRDALDTAIALLKSTGGDLAALTSRFEAAHRDLLRAAAMLAEPGPGTRPAPTRGPVSKTRPAPRAPRNGDDHGAGPVLDGVSPKLRAGERRILLTLSRHHPTKLTKAQLGTLAGFKATKSGTFNAYQSTLKTAGLITIDNGLYSATDTGLACTGTNVPAPMTTEELLEQWRAALPREGARRMLDALVDRYPDPMTRDELAELTGITYPGGTFGAYLSTLRTNGLADVDGQRVTASPTLFLTGT